MRTAATILPVRSMLPSAPPHPGPAREERQKDVHVGLSAVDSIRALCEKWLPLRALDRTRAALARVCRRSRGVTDRAPCVAIQPDRFVEATLEQSGLTAELLHDRDARCELQCPTIRASAPRQFQSASLFLRQAV